MSLSINLTKRGGIVIRLSKGTLVRATRHHPELSSEGKVKVVDSDRLATDFFHLLDGDRERLTDLFDDLIVKVVEGGSTAVILPDEGEDA